MTNHTQRFCLIGEGKLTIHCTRTLLKRGHTIQAIISENKDIISWARSHSIPTEHPKSEYIEFLKQFEFDFLLSIINPNKTRPEILRLPQKRAINFHDSPLPRYAGLHVTSWAIQNRETHHAVTWHEMTDDCDAGRIFVQESVPIENKETPYSLNAKCFEKGIESFDQLLDQIGQDTLEGREQDLSQRSVFLSTRRPDAAGVINWERSAEDIEAFIRGLSYQPDVNPLGTPKIKIGKRYCIVQEASLSSSISGTPPGTIQAIENQELVVSCGSGAIQVHSLLDIDGQSLDFEKLIQYNSLEAGTRLPLLDETESVRLNKLDTKLGKQEAYWRARLGTINPLAIHGSAQTSSATGKAIGLGQPKSYSVNLPESLATIVQSNWPEIEPGDFILALSCLYFQRISESASFDIGVGDTRIQGSSDPELIATRRPFPVEVNLDSEVAQGVEAVIKTYSKQKRHGLYNRDLVARTPGLTVPHFPISVDLAGKLESISDATEYGSTLRIQLDGSRCEWVVSSDISNGQDLANKLSTFILAACDNLNAPLSSISLLGQEEKEKILFEWNATDKAFEQEKCVHQLFEEQVLARPNDVAICFRDQSITYQELNSKSNVIAQRIQELGASPDTLVGIFIERSIEMVIALLGTLKAGAAYVPLDPAYPRERVALMISDANAPIILTSSKYASEVPASAATTLEIENVLQASGQRDCENPQSNVSPSHLAYVIYTSGSTGKPKGVMLEHRNVVNFFAGMDDTLDFEGDPGVWLAVTSISFDISVLEIFWTLARGFKVIIQEEEARTLGGSEESVSRNPRPLNVGLFYFSSDAGPSGQKDRYRLLKEGAKFADTHHFSTVWTPERHFHLFGGLYPNPSVTSAAIAALTENIDIRAGSIVLPLHNPVRVAEEWSVVDNLSNGRVGFSFASGWHANDFVLAPENYPDRKRVMFEGIDTILKLWAGESVAMKNGEGNEFKASVFPPPIQKRPPIWITTAGNIETFRMAGEKGFNILTNLLGQNVDVLGKNLAAYREAWEQNGHEGEGNVSVMVHTFLGTNPEEVKRIVKGPFCHYLKTSFDLVKIAPWAFPAFSQPSKAASQDPTFDADSFTDEDMDALMEHAFERYFETAGVFGTPESVLPLIDQLKEITVDEIACLVDFGVEDDLVLGSLEHLNRLREIANPSEDTDGSNFSVAAQIQRHKVTHFQCTPSMARILSSDPETFEALSTTDKCLLGGEALPSDLAATLKSKLKGDLINVYGPTETTIWSTSCPVPVDSTALTIGRPIANTQIYILDKAMQPTAVGIAGELFIGGEGVARGYLGQSELTAERFLPNPFRDPSKDRIYRTGDLCRYREDGEIEFLGRLDHQVKLRGYRIELGEIESEISKVSGVKDCVVVAPQNEEEAQTLSAYIVPGTPDSTANSNTDESPEHWKTIWDETYKSGVVNAEGETDQIDNDDPTFNYTGWLNSYTGEHLSHEDMKEWLDATEQRILALQPKRVLEIGCGTGMVLYRVAKHCESYTGVDFSDSALSMISEQLPQLGLTNVELIQSAADQLDLKNLPPFDLVIINSVSQYFPNEAYLTKVLELAANAIGEKGHIFLGDARSFIHRTTFHSSIVIENAPTSLPIADLKIHAEEKSDNEAELLIHPSYFESAKKAIPRIRHSQIELKRGQLLNEMTRFRYDALLTIGGGTPERIQPAVQQFDPETTSIETITRLATEASGPVLLTDIPNPRVWTYAKAEELLANPNGIATAGDLRQALDSIDPSIGIDPEALYQLEIPGNIRLTWARSGDAACYDALIVNTTEANPLDIDTPSSPAPSRCVFEPKRQSVDFELVGRVKEHLRSKLPDFMVPSSFMILEKMPLTPNGKIDRRALPKPEKRQRESEVDYQAPASEIEKAIASVWQDMLNIEKVSANDNFFNLGANSLLMVQANNRLKQKLNQNVSLVRMFRYPTIASLAAHLSGENNESESVNKAAKRGAQRREALGNRRNRLARRKSS